MTDPEYYRGGPVGCSGWVALVGVFLAVLAIAAALVWAANT